MGPFIVYLKHFVKNKCVLSVVAGCSTGCNWWLWEVFLLQLQWLHTTCIPGKLILEFLTFVVLLRQILIWVVLEAKNCSYRPVSSSSINVHPFYCLLYLSGESNYVGVVRLWVAIRPYEPLLGYFLSLWFQCIHLCLLSCLLNYLFSLRSYSWCAIFQNF